MCNTNGEGVAVCRCGSQLHIVCSGGCTDPDVVFKSERATIRKPRHVPNPRKTRRFRPGFCTHPGCDDPIAPRPAGAIGHPWTKCIKHLAVSRKYTANRKAKSEQRVAA
jgi:hypothetical protein